MESPYSKETYRLDREIKRTKDALPFSVVSTIFGLLGYFLGKGTISIIFFLFFLAVLVFFLLRIRFLSIKAKEVASLNREWLQEKRWQILFKLYENQNEKLESDKKP